MERVPVESSCLAAVGYDPADGALELEFTSGSVYRYLAVPEDVHRGCWLPRASAGTSTRGSGTATSTAGSGSQPGCSIRRPRLSAAAPWPPLFYGAAVEQEQREVVGLAADFGDRGGLQEVAAAQGPEGPQRSGAWSAAGRSRPAEVVSKPPPTGAG